MRQYKASASLLMHVASSLLNELRPSKLLQKRNVVDIFLWHVSDIWNVHPGLSRREACTKYTTIFIFSDVACSK